jgi:hypothetical protein
MQKRKGTGGILFTFTKLVLACDGVGGGDGEKLITSSSYTTSQTAIRVSESSFLYAPTFLLFFASPKSLAPSTCHTASELGKQLKTCGSSNCLFSNSYFQTF